VTSGTVAAPARLRVTRRGIQIVLGLLWLLDGLLQFQPAMLTPKFAVEVIAPAGAGQPGFIAGPVAEVVRITLHQPVIMDVAFGLIQLALGAGILYARTARRALAASVAWALLVWYLGEGLGGLAGGSSSLLTGAPGAALLYAVLALAASPRRDGAAAAEGPPRWTAVAWAGLWLGGAVLQLLPERDTNASIAMSLAMNASGTPAWFAPIGAHLAALVPDGGVSIVVDLIVLQVFAGIGALRGPRVRRAAVIVGCGLSLACWVAGQGMGQPWSGLATDPGTAPLVVLLGFAVLGAAPSRRPVGEPDQGPEALDAPSAARPEVPAGAGEGTH
jgi:hypothetical protein